MRQRRLLAGQVQATQPQSGQRSLTGKGICLPRTRHPAQAQVPDQSFSCYHQRMVNSWAMASGEKRIDLSEEIA